VRVAVPRQVSGGTSTSASTRRQVNTFGGDGIWEREENVAGSNCLETEEKRRAILKDLRERKGNWLAGAAQAMADAMEKDWRAWRERRQS